jgi:DNA-dependent RNA polymerase auxiliary subunit epsilon
MKKLTLQTDAELIRSYLSGTVAADLSAKLAEKLHRIDFCRDLIANYLSKYKCVERLQKEFGINRNQAYTLYYETEVVYDARQIRLDKFFENLAETRKVALLKYDSRTLAACDKNEIQAIKEFYGDKEEDYWKNLQMPDVTLEFNPALVRKELENEQYLLSFIGMMQEKYANFGEAKLIQVAAETTQES